MGGSASACSLHHTKHSVSGSCLQHQVKGCPCLCFRGKSADRSAKLVTLVTWACIASCILSVSSCYVCLCACVCACMHRCVSRFVCKCVCVCVYACVCVYRCAHLRAQVCMFCWSLCLPCTASNNSSLVQRELILLGGCENKYACMYILHQQSMDIKNIQGQNKAIHNNRGTRTSAAAELFIINFHCSKPENKPTFPGQVLENEIDI